MTALIGSPALIASSKGFNIRQPAPSPGPKPLARLSKAKDLPSDESSLEKYQPFHHRLKNGMNDSARVSIILGRAASPRQRTQMSYAYLMLDLAIRRSGRTFRCVPPTIACVDSLARKL